jgi:hypothetical protein
MLNHVYLIIHICNDETYYDVCSTIEKAHKRVQFLIEGQYDLMNEGQRQLLKKAFTTENNEEAMELYQKFTKDSIEIYYKKLDTL